MDYKDILLMPFRISLILFIVCTLPLSFCWELTKKICKWILKAIVEQIIMIVRLCMLSRLLSQISKFAQNEKQKQNEDQTLSSVYLSPRSKQKHIESICMQAELSPQKQTKNSKILLLMQKITTLQQDLFKQSKIRCGVQRQIFNINIQTIQKDYEITSIKRQNISVMKSIRSLQNQLLQLQEQIIEQEQNMEILQEQIDQLKQYIDSLKSKK